MIFDPNPLFYEMVSIYKNNKHKPDKVTICNEGSSRSSKTWDFFHFLVMFCENNSNAHNEIYILRETLTDCKDFTFKEFQKCLKVMKIWDDDNYKNPQKPFYNLYGNDIYFRGLDDSSEGYPSDITFVNEALENQNKEKVEGIDMRCRKLMVYDWNPKYTQHWCFNLEGQPNVHFTHSTFRNNKHLEQSVINKILSYCPWDFNDLELPEKKRRPNIVNIENGTADKYRWQVYGEGIRSAPEGLIFEHVTWIDEFPDIGFSYTLDFGFTTDPTVLNKYAEDTHNIWIEPLLWESTENADLIHEFALANKIDIKLPTTADSADKYTGENKGTVEMVSDLRIKGWNISKVSKTKSVMYWLTSMKKKKIHIVKNHNYSKARKEQENYIMKKINGIAINQPIDKFNHMWDSARYGHIANNQPKIVVY
jgi:PBSX family phage terminase large subunit